MKMQNFSNLYELTPEGLDLFQRIMLRELDEHALDVGNADHALPIAGSMPFAAAPFKTAKEMAVAICDSLGTNDVQELAGRTGLWAWLYFVLIDVLSPKKVNGERKIMEFVRWFPSSPNDYQKAQRHLVRMPVLLHASLGIDADHLICGKPDSGPEIREQLTSQQDMFSINFQRACRTLYFDDKMGALKKGIAGKDSAGSTRRMAQVRKQLDVTWDMTDLAADRILHLLPQEFDGFKPMALAA
jgi:hypothetical protein